jgi:hypothetical protein
MRAIPVCFSLAILIALTSGVNAADSGKGKGGSDSGGIWPVETIVKPVQTVVEAPIKIIQGVVSPATKPKG